MKKAKTVQRGDIHEPTCKLPLLRLVQRLRHRNEAPRRRLHSEASTELHARSIQATVARTILHSGFCLFSARDYLTKAPAKTAVTAMAPWTSCSNEAHSSRLLRCLPASGDCFELRNFSYLCFCSSNQSFSANERSLKCLSHRGPFFPPKLEGSLSAFEKKYRSSKVCPGYSRF